MKKKEQFNLALWDRLKQNNIPHSFETRRGDKVTQVTQFNTSRVIVCGVLNGDVDDWNIDGVYFDKDTSSVDLFIVWDEEQLILEGWMNIYENGNANYHFTKEEAEIGRGDTCIACVKVSIPYTKGEGLSDG